MRNNQTASFYPNLTDMLKAIINDIAENILKEGQPIVIVGDYSWYREVLSLFAKQVNLCDSCILLLENGMEQEAYLLARSQFNNMLWIKYICSDTDNEKVKEYFYQSHISQIRNSSSFKKMLEDFEGELDERFDKESMMLSLDSSIEENKEILRRENIPNKVKTVAELSRKDGTAFGMYITLYNEGSKFEHSEISKTKKYRKKVIDGYTEDQVFTIDLGSSNKDEWFTVFRYSLMCVFFAFSSLYERIKTRENHLFDESPNGKIYLRESFEQIHLKLFCCMQMLEKAEQNIDE